MTDERIILEGKVAGGFEVREFPGRAVPYRDVATFTRQEYESSKSLKEAVANGWLILSKNTRRKLNLTFSKRSQPSLPPYVQDSVDKNSIKEELRAELLPQMIHMLSEALRGNQTELIQKLLESNERNTQLLERVLISGVQPVAQPTVQGTQRQKIEVSPDELFIPNQIRSEELKGNLSFEKSEATSVDDVSNALKALKKGKK